MIRTPTATGWLLTMQPAHALLATQAVAAWGNEGFTPPPRRAETLVAVSQHDVGWVEWEQAPTLTAEGEPRDFMHMPLEEHLANWRRGVAYARHQGAWTGLLVSRHATTLYEGRRSEPDVAAFIARQQPLQAAWREVAGASEEEVAMAYAFVRWSDWLSLVLCMDHHRERGGPVELGVGPQGVAFTLHWRAEDRAAISPWPFQAARLDLHVESLRLDEKRFPDDASYRAAVESAARVERWWRLDPSLRSRARIGE